MSCPHDDGIRCTCWDGPDGRDLGPGSGAWVWPIVTDGVTDGHITVQRDSAQMHDGGSGKENIQVDPHGTQWCREGPGVTWRRDRHSEDKAQGIKLTKKSLKSIDFPPLQANGPCEIIKWTYSTKLNWVISLEGMRMMSSWEQHKSLIITDSVFSWHADEKLFNFYNITSIIIHHGSCMALWWKSLLL